MYEPFFSFWWVLYALQILKSMLITYTDNIFVFFFGPIRIIPRRFRTPNYNRVLNISEEAAIFIQRLFTVFVDFNAFHMLSHCLSSLTPRRSNVLFIRDFIPLGIINALPRTSVGINSVSIYMISPLAVTYLLNSTLWFSPIPSQLRFDESARPRLLLLLLYHPDYSLPEQILSLPRSSCLIIKNTITY